MHNSSVSAIFAVFHLAMVILFATKTEYAAPGVNDTSNYTAFQDVHVMIAIGFGFLMAFLYKNAFTTIGHSFMVMSFVAFWAILNVGFWHRVVETRDILNWGKIQIGIKQLIEADFAAGAVLISFGAMVGRLSADQLLIMAFFEIIFYCINEAIAVERFLVADMGGSMIIHIFGAYFGLACSHALEYGNEARQRIFAKYATLNTSSKDNDTFAMIGTLFLWCFWPSFNGALSGKFFEVTVVNTYLSIAASCLISFYTIRFFTKGKFHMVEIQNSTLAGGVAIGTVANMVINPHVAMIIGSFAGFISVVGYQKLLPIFPVRDTCGIHNLHGMPGVLAAIASIALASQTQPGDYTFGSTPGRQFTTDLGDVFPSYNSTIGVSLDTSNLALYQVYTLMTTLAIALVGGSITGRVLRTPALNLERFFTDTEEWKEVHVDKVIEALDVCEPGEDVELKPDELKPQSCSSAPTVTSPGA